MDNYSDIDNEIKNNFESNSKSPFGFVILILLLIVWALAIFFHHRNQRIAYYWDEKKISSVMLDWVTYSLSDVKVLSIPDEVYDSIWDDSSWSEYLLWSKNHMLFIFWDGCPYARAYNYMIEKTFSNDTSLDLVYSKDIAKVSNSRVIECHNEYCPELRLNRVCGTSFCIINPVVNEIVVDWSQNPEQIPILLNFYADWKDLSLLK